VAGRKAKKEETKKKENCWKIKKRQVLRTINLLLSFDTTWTAYKTKPPTILPCSGNVFTELLPSNKRGVTD
jgi:hypothetical protein